MMHFVMVGIQMDMFTKISLHVSLQSLTKIWIDQLFVSVDCFRRTVGLCFWLLMAYIIISLLYLHVVLLPADSCPLIYLGTSIPS